MEKLLFRHGLSGANDKNTPAFGRSDASLMYRGWFDAFGAGSELEDSGINIATAEVAVSTMLRTGQTAFGAGVLPENMTQYERLDEINHGLGLVTLRFMLDNRIYPKAALVAADQLLDDLPPESIYFTHGLRISAMVYMAHGEAPDVFIPKFATMTRLRPDDRTRQDLSESIEVMRERYERLVTEKDVRKGVDPFYGLDS